MKKIPKKQAEDMLKSLPNWIVKKLLNKWKEKGYIE